MIPPIRDDEHDRPMPDDRLIDLLVDGELPGDERRALLLRLESEPDGWRRCALAFLEAQSWRQTFGGLAREVSAPRPSSPEILTLRPRRRLQAPRLAAWAAGLLAAFALGWSAAGSSRAPAPHIADAPKPAASPGATDLGPKHDRTAVAVQGSGGGEAAKDGPSLPPRLPPKAEAVAKAETPAPPPSFSVPGYVRGQLESRGYRVEKRRGLVIGVSDGRRVAVPAEKVQIRYVGRRTS